MDNYHFDQIDPKTLTVQDIIALGMLLLRAFVYRGWGNPYNYNRFFEFLQANKFGLELCGVGGGSDAFKWFEDIKKTYELKLTSLLGQLKNGNDKSHSFSYNGTSVKDTLEEQERYCRDKIFRDEYHFWTIFDSENGDFYKTYKVPSQTVWNLLWPKWEKSWYQTQSKTKKPADPRIGASISTTQLTSSKLDYELIVH